VRGTAYKEISKAYPNYGKKTDMGARQWWTEVSDYPIFLSDFSFRPKPFLSNVYILIHNLGHHQNIHTPPPRSSTVQPHINTNKPFLVQRRLYLVSRCLLPTIPVHHTTTLKECQAKISHRCHHKLRRQSP
jgi:hypothetical protein